MDLQGVDGENNDASFEATINTAGTTMTVTSVPADVTIQLGKVLSAVGLTDGAMIASMGESYTVTYTGYVNHNVLTVTSLGSGYPIVGQHISWSSGGTHTSFIINTVTGSGQNGSYIIENSFDYTNVVTFTAINYGAVVQARIIQPGTTLEVTKIIRGVVSSGQMMNVSDGTSDTLSLDGTSETGIITATVSFDGNILIVHSIAQALLSVGMEIKSSNSTDLFNPTTTITIISTTTGSGGVGNYTLSSSIDISAQEMIVVSIHYTGTGGIGTYGLNSTHTGYSNVFEEYRMTYTGSGGIGTYGLTAHQTKHTNIMTVIQVEEGSNGDRRTACITIVDLATLNPRAMGFRRGFVGYPYIYLSPGQYNVGVRLDMESPRIDKISIVDLLEADRKYGGYSGGFEDRGWACFNPSRTFTGPAGGLRSDLLVDKNSLRPYYHGEVLCVGKDAWDHTKNLTDASFFTFDLSTIEPNLRGFSEAIRVGRYAYFAPLSYTPFDYASKMIRLDLGSTSVYQMYIDMIASGGVIKEQCVILDLSQANPNLVGFSGIVQHGRFLVLSPYRNSFEPVNGQRGHGYLARVDMNDFDISGITYLDLTVTPRNQIPTMAEIDFRGFATLTASGQYAIFVPFFAGYFTGKIARTKASYERDDFEMDRDLQNLNLETDRDYPRLMKGFRGGVASLWKVVFDERNE